MFVRRRGSGKSIGFVNQRLGVQFLPVASGIMVHFPDTGIKMLGDDGMNMNQLKVTEVTQDGRVIEKLPRKKWTGEKPKPAVSDKIDVHGYGRDLELQADLLERSAVSEENKEVIKDFVNYCKTNPKMHEAITIKYSYVLRRIGELINKPFKEMNEHDINALIARLQGIRTDKNQPYSVWTMNDFRKTISKFWRWLYFDECGGDAPKPIKRFQIKESTGKKEPEIYTKAEIEKLINGTTNPRDRAFFSCIYDLGCRVSELLSRQIKHIRFTEDGEIEILIEAEKTSVSHYETIFESSPYFNIWLRMHPCPNNDNAPLWTMQRKKGDIEPLTYPAIRKTFLGICKRQSIRPGKKNIIHMIRKSKATHDMADGVPITYIESRGSWSKGSQALQNCYLSVQKNDKDNAYRKKYNLVKEEKKETTRLVSCRRCNMAMKTDDRFCVKCGLPADSKAFAEMQEAKKKINLETLIDKDMLDELVKKAVMQMLKNQKKTDDIDKRSHESI